jgi:hypothetical protein
MGLSLALPQEVVPLLHSETDQGELAFLSKTKGAGFPTPFVLL